MHPSESTRAKKSNPIENRVTLVNEYTENRVALVSKNIETGVALVSMYTAFFSGSIHGICRQDGKYLLTYR